MLNAKSPVPICCLEDLICLMGKNVSYILPLGPSEMRGYLLWERYGVQLRIGQWEWIRMKISTPTYLDRLRSLMDDLREIISILGPIRINSDEGQMGFKAKQEFREVDKLIQDLSKQSLTTSTMTSPSSALTSKQTSPPLVSASVGHVGNVRYVATMSVRTTSEERHLSANRNSICA